MSFGRWVGMIRQKKLEEEGFRQRVGMQVGKGVFRGGVGCRGKGRWMLGQGGSMVFWVVIVIIVEIQERVEGGLGFSGIQKRRYKGFWVQKKDGDFVFEMFLWLYLWVT